MGNFNDVSFDTIKQNNRFDNTLTYRGVVKASGLTYDYMDKLNDFIKQGIFIDEKGDGFTAAEKKALEAEYRKIHLEKGYNINFNTMLPGTTFEYDYNDFIRMAQAAGYILKDEPQEGVIEEEFISEENKAPESNNSQSDVVSTPKSAEDLLYEELNSDPELAGKSGEEKSKILKDREFSMREQLSELQKPATYRTKKVLFWGGKEKTRELTPEEKAERERLSSELQEKLDENKKMQKFVGALEGKFWNGRYSPDASRDLSGNVLEEYPSYNRVTVVDAEGKERRAAEVVSYEKPDEYSFPEEVRRYYSMDVKKVGNFTPTQGEYWEVVPDMNNELKGYEPKKYNP